MPVKKKSSQQDQPVKNMDDILNQWRRERPEIDPSPMAVCGDLWRTADVVKAGVEANLKNYGLDFPQFDVILTLRRQGRGHTLSPSVLAKEMMLSTSAMTNRLDRLEKRGLIERITDPNDRRGLKIALTQEGFTLANDIVETHVQAEERLLVNLSHDERDQLRSLLAKIV